MKNNEKVPFLQAAMKALHQTERVLGFHDLAPERAAPMDFVPYIQAMLRLCHEHHLDDDAIKHLQHVKSVVGEMRGQVAPSELKAGEESAAQYEEWLRSAFPEAFAQMRKEASERLRKHALN